MAKSIEEILGKSISTTKELREAIKSLQDQLVTASEGTQEWVDTADKLTAAQSKLTEVMNAGKSSVDAAEDSIVGMEKQYKELYNTYKLLTDEQRNSPFGKEMAGQLETLSTKLNETKKGVGNFKDNIGRYADDAVAAFNTMGVSIGGLTGPLALANGGFKALNATMLANPLFWIIAALKVLIDIFNKVKDAITGNEESQMRLNQAMAAFQPVIDAVNNAFDALGRGVVTVVEWFGKAFTKIRELQAGFTDFIGITKGAKKEIQEQNKLYADLAKRTNELTLAKREQTKLNAEQQAEVKTLLDQAAGTADATEKMNLLNEAKRIQSEITERNIRIAQEEYNLLYEKSKLTANSAEDNEKLAQAEAAVARAKAEGAEKTKEMTSQILGLTKQTDKYTEALKKEQDEVKELLKTIDENSKTELQKLEDKYQKEKALLEKHGKDTVKLTKQYEDEKNDLIRSAFREQYELEKDLQNRLASGDAEKEAKNAFNEAQKRLKFLKEAVARATAEISTVAAEAGTKGFFVVTEEIQNIWKETGESLIPPEKMFTADDAKKLIKIYEKVAKEAGEAYDRVLSEKLKEQNNSQLTKDSLDGAISKIDITNSEVLTEQEKADAIAAIDEALLKKRMNNIQWELENLTLTNDEKLALWNEYYAAVDTLETDRQNKLKEAEQAQLELDNLQFERNANLITDTGTLTDSIGAIADAISMNIERTMEDEEATEESVAKKKKALKTLQDIQMAVGLATIAADTATGIMSIWRGYALEKITNAETAAATGPAAAVTLTALNAKSLASAIIQTASMGVMGAAQMAALISGTISNKKSIDGESSGGGAAGTVASPAVIETTPYSYTRQIQTAEEEQQLNQPIWVSVTDIENGLNHVRVVDEESSW